MENEEPLNSMELSHTQKLAVVHTLDNFPTFQGTPRFTAAITKAF
jgi:hypothetical protein